MGGGARPESTRSEKTMGRPVVFRPLVIRTAPQPHWEHVEWVNLSSPGRGGLKYIGGPSLPFQLAPNGGLRHGPNHPGSKNDSMVGGGGITIAIFLEENKHYNDSHYIP